MSCWDQLTALLFGQLTGSRSLRDLVTGFNSKSAHHYHLGTRTIRRSSLSDANSHRPTAVFQETFFYLLEQVRNKLTLGQNHQPEKILHKNQFQTPQNLILKYNE